MQQLGFDLDFADPVTQKVVPWQAFDAQLVARIKAAPWKIVDIETTGLTPASKESNFSGKQLRQGNNPKLRLRVISALIPDSAPSKSGITKVSFDMDKLTSEEKSKVAEACLTNWLINWNVGFDLYWLRQLSKTEPTKVIDAMLLARLLVPHVPLTLAEMANNEHIDETLQEEAKMVFMAKKQGWSLAHVYLALFHVILPKEMQGPKNWAAPYLTQQAYDYAVSDTQTVLDIMLKIMELEQGDYDKLMDRYEELLAIMPTVQALEPQVMEVVLMREKGMPWNRENASKYAEHCLKKVKDSVKELLDMQPSLNPFSQALLDMGEGINQALKTAVGQAFLERGVPLSYTEKTGLPMIGEKDLRKARAATGDTEKLFGLWVSICKTKKAAGMCQEVTQFALRGGDWRLHPLTGHGPVTGRLASKEPNCQQFPRDQKFRDCVWAAMGHKIVASDYSALDMRVGAALAIRAQLRIWEVYEGTRKTSPDVARVIEKVLSRKGNLEVLRKEEENAFKAFKAHKDLLRDENADNLDKKSFWDKYRTLHRQNLLSRFARCLQEVMEKAWSRGERTWGSLRDAFAIDGMDIHTWTALGMLGRDPAALLSGLSNEDIAVRLKELKHELGDARMTGKVGNLSLLYAMQVDGLLDAAAKNYNIHWTYEEAAKVRKDWFATYVEIDLWHAWTELNPYTSVYIPDPERGGRFSKKDVYASYTLGGRLIYAFGLNAALSYEDQSTGADILGVVMHTLRTQYPAIFDCIVNQVHDEVVFEIPDEFVESYTATIHTEMVAAAEKFLSVYGVKGECSPAIGQGWVKD